MPPAKLAYRSPCKSHLLSIMEFNCNCKASTARFWSSSVREDNVWSSVSTGGGSKSPGGSESSSLSSSSLSLPSSSPAFSSSPHWCPGEKGPSQFRQFSSLFFFFLKPRLSVKVCSFGLSTCVKTWQVSISEEESQNLSSQVLPPGLLVIHDASGGGQHHLNRRVYNWASFTWSSNF